MTDKTDNQRIDLPRGEIKKLSRAELERRVFNGGKRWVRHKEQIAELKKALDNQAMRMERVRELEIKFAERGDRINMLKVEAGRNLKWQEEYKDLRERHQKTLDELGKERAKSAELQRRVDHQQDHITNLRAGLAGASDEAASLMEDAAIARGQTEVLTSIIDRALAQKK